MNIFQWLNAKIFDVKYIKYINYGEFYVSPVKEFLTEPYYMYCPGTILQKWAPLSDLNGDYEVLS